MKPRVADERDLEGVTATLTAAFEADPLWSWAFPDRRDMEVWWGYLVASALRYPWVWVLGDYDATSVWIPPGGSELTEAEEARIEPLLAELIGERAADVSELLRRFDHAHPGGPPHFYLSLLGTHPDHGGKGLGMGLLAANLARIDDDGMPAYLESSNPANDRRYERQGFVRAGEFDRPDGRVTVSTMWRDPA